jgi:hypothetical protein
MAAVLPINVEITPNIGAIVRPGDTLIVGYPDRDISQAEADEMQKRMEALLPEIIVIIIPASSMAVYRSGPAKPGNPE